MAFSTIDLFTDDNKDETAIWLAREKFKSGKAAFDSWWCVWLGRCGLNEFREALAIQLGVLGRKHMDTALSYFWIGRSLKRNSQPQQSLIEFANALSIQEAVQGRHHIDTLVTYYLFGDTLELLGHTDMAAVAFRSASRMKQACLQNLKIPPAGINPDQRLATLLRKKGLDMEAIEAVSLGITKSVMNEQNGDALREKGRFSDALAFYDIALQVETADAGLPNPEVAYLWRKIACIWSLRVPQRNKFAFWKSMDRIESSDWLGAPQKCRYRSACQAIQIGDYHFAHLNPEDALLEYKKAVVIVKQRNDILMMALLFVFLVLCVVTRKVLGRVMNKTETSAASKESCGNGVGDEGATPERTKPNTTQTKTKVEILLRAYGKRMMQRLGSLMHKTQSGATSDESDVRRASVQGKVIEPANPNTMESATKVEILLDSCKKSMSHQLTHIKKLVDEEAGRTRAMAEFHKAARYEKLFVDQLINSFATTFPGLAAEHVSLESCRRTLDDHLSHVKGMVEAKSQEDAEMSHRKALELQHAFLGKLGRVAAKMEESDHNEPDLIEETDDGVLILKGTSNKSD
jgi:tetratricopeptide (TPR) repeat protein